MRVLIADADPTSRAFLETTLTRWGYEVTVADSGAEVGTVVRQTTPQVAILDWRMPGLEALKLCETVRKGKEANYTYILLATSRDNQEEIVRGLHGGADDYLLKPYEPLELQARLIAGRRIIDLQGQLVAARELLRHQAIREPLTGLWNYRGIMDILERELHRAQREGRPLGVILADLDHFQKINADYGHLAGDEVLREVTRRMGAAMRPYDLTGRYGGEEFLIVLPGCDRIKVMKVGERIRQQVAGRPVPFQDQQVAVTISLGGVVHTPPNPVEIHALLHTADTSLFWAKHNGRNRMEVGTLGGD